MAFSCDPWLMFSQQETWYWPGEVSADAVVMSGVRCSGTEMSLSHCLHHGAHLSCPKGGGRNAAGVSCSESKTPNFSCRRWFEKWPRGHVM